MIQLPDLAVTLEKSSTHSHRDLESEMMKQEAVLSPPGGQYGERNQIVDWEMNAL